MEKETTKIFDLSDNIVWAKHTHTPVLAVDGVSVSGGVDHGEAELHSSLLDLHRGRLDLDCPLDLL